MYRNFRGAKINFENLPIKDKVESFWKSIWCENVTFNKDAPQINDLFLNYCKDAKQNVYSINLKTLNTVINKINPSKAPGRDIIIGFWDIKRDYYRENFATLPQNTYDGEINLPDWLSLAKTTLTLKNENTHIAKKIPTNNSFSEHHV